MGNLFGCCTEKKKKNPIWKIDDTGFKNVQHPVYTKPTYHSPVSRRMKAGTLFRVLERNGHWLRTQFGWIPICSEYGDTVCVALY